MKLCRHGFATCLLLVAFNGCSSEAPDATISSGGAAAGATSAGSSPGGANGAGMAGVAAPSSGGEAGHPIGPTAGAGSGGSNASGGAPQGGGAGASESAGNAGAGGSAAGSGSRAGASGAGASGAGASGGPSAYNPCPSDGTDCTIMPLGDSITDGYTVRGGYRIPFFQRGHQEGKHFTFVGSQVNGPTTVDNVPFPQHHEGHSAHTIYDAPNAPIPRKGIADYVADVIPRYHPDIVLLMIGTNDVDGQVDLPNAPKRLGTFIDSLIALDSRALIVVAQITPTMQDPLNQAIVTYNAGIPAVVKSRADAGKHVLLVDMYSAFVKDAAFKSKYLADRLHPNATGYQVMSDVWNSAIHDLIR